MVRRLRGLDGTAAQIYSPPCKGPRSLGGPSACLGVAGSRRVTAAAPSSRTRGCSPGRPSGTSRCRSASTPRRRPLMAAQPAGSAGRHGAHRQRPGGRRGAPRLARPRPRSAAGRWRTAGRRWPTAAGPWPTAGRPWTAAPRPMTRQPHFHPTHASRSRPRRPSAGGSRGARGRPALVPRFGNEQDDQRQRPVRPI